MHVCSYLVSCRYTYTLNICKKKCVKKDIYFHYFLYVDIKLYYIHMINFWHFKFKLIKSNGNFAHLDQEKHEDTNTTNAINLRNSLLNNRLLLVLIGLR